MAFNVEILSRLQKDILQLQGFKPGITDKRSFILPAAIRQSFPHQTFPLNAVHEFICFSPEETSASLGFISGLLSSITNKNGIIFWATPLPIFPPALKSFGLEPHKMIFLQQKGNKDLLWSIEEAIKCNGLSAVIGGINEISLLESRRLQLAVEKSQVTVFLIRQNPKNKATASFSRWHINPVCSQTSLPGLGFPRWKATLEKIKNGKPGNWILEWNDGKLIHIPEIPEIKTQLLRKIG